MSLTRKQEAEAMFGAGATAEQQQFRDKFEGLGERLGGPRSWSALLARWIELVSALAGIVGRPPEPLSEKLISGWPYAIDLHIRAWNWMWALPPCSEARKAAFTLGQAAREIERWRRAPKDPERTSWGSEEDPGFVSAVADLHGAVAIGQRAEALLRIARWHLDDAQGEAVARKLGGERPTIPAWERVYCVGVPLPPDRGGHQFAPLQGRVLGEVALQILSDHQAFPTHRRTLQMSTAEARDGVVDTFVLTALTSLPYGPWVMTSSDVERFLGMIREDEQSRGAGPWRAATHRTRGGELEIRERADGRYDVRAVGEQPLGWVLENGVAERGVDAAYVRAELEVKP